VKTCKVEGCGKPFLARGFCGMHYRRWRLGDKTITADSMSRAHPYGGAPCSVPHCDSLARENGMCAKHAQRVRRYGDPDYVTPEELRRLASRLANLANVIEVKETTYRKYLGRHTHRRVAEEKLGRPLRKGEVVHHIDGNRHNNDPSNLAVMTQSEHIALHRADMEKARGRPS
jgi:hypothetical protein